MPLFFPAFSLSQSSHSGLPMSTATIRPLSITTPDFPSLFSPTAGTHRFVLPLSFSSTKLRFHDFAFSHIHSGIQSNNFFVSSSSFHIQSDDTPKLPRVRTRYTNPLLLFRILRVYCLYISLDYSVYLSLYFATQWLIKNSIHEIFEFAKLKLGGFELFSFNLEQHNFLKNNSFCYALLQLYMP